jgi:hypothetical protein
VDHDPPLPPSRQICFDPTGESGYAYCDYASSWGKKLRARKNEFRKPDQRDLGRPVPTQKIFLFSFYPKCVFLRPSRLIDEGRIAIVTNVERGMRWTRRCRVRMRSQGGATRERSREARKTSGIDADGEVVWSWYPLLVSS